jgi:topoisomerase-4 subunit A
LNVDERGELVGEFRGEDRILVITQAGIVKTIIPEITARFDDDMIIMEKWIPKKPISAIYFDGEKERYFVKRFLVENESKEECFISDHENSHLEIVSTDWKPVAEVEFTKERGKDRKDNLEINLEEFIAVKGINALGNQLTKDKVNQINLLDPIPYEAPEEVPAEEIEVVDETDVSDETKSEENKEKKDSNGEAPPDFEIDEEGQITLF